MPAAKRAGHRLPRIHRDAINDHLWGDGYTEWWRVRNATSLFPGHIQPHVPLHGHHYDLSQRRELAKQLRAVTGASARLCEKALQSHADDMERAANWLLEQGDSAKGGGVEGAPSVGSP